VCDYYSDRSEHEPVQCSSGKVNAIAGSNRRRNQQTVAELEETESSTSTSDESSDDEMDTELSESVSVQSAVSDAVADAVGDIKTDTASVETDSFTADSSAASQRQKSAENSAAENEEPVRVRPTVVHIAVNRTAEIQVSLCVLDILLLKLSVHVFGVNIQ